MKKLSIPKVSKYSNDVLTRSQLRKVLGGQVAPTSACGMQDEYCNPELELICCDGLVCYHNEGKCDFPTIL